MSAPTNQITARLLRLPAVIDRCGISRALIYKHVNDNTFPQPVIVGTRHVAWREADVEAWIASRPPAKRPGKCPMKRSTIRENTVK